MCRKYTTRLKQAEDNYNLSFEEVTFSSTKGKRGMSPLTTAIIIISAMILLYILMKIVMNILDKGLK